jgi:hypothetical protein
VEEARVYNVPELPSKERGSQRIRDLELHQTCRFGRQGIDLSSRTDNGSFDKIDPQDFVSETRQINGQITGATANIQDGTRGWVSGKEGSHRRLRFANFPGRDVFVNGIEKRKWIRSKSAQKILLILM